MLKNLKLATKLTFSFGLVASIALALGLLGYYGIKLSDNSMDEIGTVRYPSVESLLVIKISALEVKTAMRTLIIADLDKAQRQSQFENLKKARERYEAAWKKYELLPHTPEESELWKRFVPSWQKWREANNVFLDMVRTIDATDSSTAAQSQKQRELYREATQHLMVTTQELQNQANDLLDKLIDLNSNLTNKEVKAAGDLSERLQFISLSAAGAGVIIAILIALVITRAITRSLAKAVVVAEELSRGNLTVSVVADSTDEIGQLLHAMGIMVINLKSMFTDITKGVETLSASSTDLAVISKQLSSAAQDTAGKSASVASATEEMSTNINSVSAAMEQSSSNVQMVATSTEEMTSTVSEIAQSAEKARSISERAVSQSRLASKKMALLGESARKISSVTETITEISEQTNLLALNATIEAARAGEAGKGFAVVANEIKELARQTASATVDIKNQISEMQTTTSTTVEDIEKISEVIVEINNVINGIATAVEEQSAASNEISSNISQAAQGIAEVNENVAQSTVVIADISRDIVDINQQSNQVGEGSSQVQVSAQGLAELATNLAYLVSKFTLKPEVIMSR